jgi:hypothetical protein
MPREPTKEIEPGELVHYLYGVKINPNFGYRVVCGDVLSAEQIAIIRQKGGSDYQLNSSLDNSVQSFPGEAKLISNKAITYSGHPGREWLLEVAGGKWLLRYREYIINHRGYLLNVVGSPQEVQSSDAEAFLDSFKLLPGEPKLPQLKKDSGKNSGSSSDPKVPATTDTRKVPAGWVKTTIPEGPCEVVAPAKPKRSVQDNLHVWSKCYFYEFADTDQGGFRASVTSVPELRQRNQLRIKSFPYALDIEIERIRGKSKLLENKELGRQSWPGFEENWPGREVVFQDKRRDALFRVRIYLISDRMYTLSVFGSREKVYSEEANAFFDSFKLLPGEPKDGR